MTSIKITKFVTRNYLLTRKTWVHSNRTHKQLDGGQVYIYLARNYSISRSDKPTDPSKTSTSDPSQGDNVVPKDTVEPPSRLRRQITTTFTNFVDRFERKLEKSTPKVFNVYQTVKNVRLIVSDAHSYFTVATQLWSGRELHTFTRKELEIYLDMPRDMVKVSALLMIFMIPFVGNFIIAALYWYPRMFFTHHLWNDKQKVEFRQHFHKKKLAYYHHILTAVDKKAHRQMTGNQQKNMLSILKKIDGSDPLSVQRLLEVKQSFESFPFSIDSLPTSYFRQIAKSCGMTKRRQRLQQDGLLLLHIDRAMVKEGIETMTENDVCKNPVDSDVYLDEPHHYAVNSKLQVQIEDHVITKSNISGCIRYIGHLDKNDLPSTLFVGLELDDPVGSHDGCVMGKRYFCCKRNHGVFVPLNDVINKGSKKAQTKSLREESSKLRKQLKRLTSKDEKFTHL